MLVTPLCMRWCGQVHERERDRGERLRLTSAGVVQLLLFILMPHSSKKQRVAYRGLSLSLSISLSLCVCVCVSLTVLALKVCILRQPQLEVLGHQLLSGYCSGAFFLSLSLSLSLSAFLCVCVSLVFTESLLLVRSTPNMQLNIRWW